MTKREEKGLLRAKLEDALKVLTEVAEEIEQLAEEYEDDEDLGNAADAASAAIDNLEEAKGNLK